MAQTLKTMFRKDGKSKGVAIKKNSITTPDVLQKLFKMAYRKHKSKNGKSKNKNS